MMGHLIFSLSNSALARSELISCQPYVKAMAMGEKFWDVLSNQRLLSTLHTDFTECNRLLKVNGASINK